MFMVRLSSLFASFDSRSGMGPTPAYAAYYEQTHSNNQNRQVRKSQGSHGNRSVDHTEGDGRIRKTQGSHGNRSEDHIERDGRIVLKKIREMEGSHRKRWRITRKEIEGS